MITGFDKPVLVGLVFDMDDFKFGSSFACNEIKRSLIEFVKKIGTNCKIYVAGNESFPKTCGETVKQIGSYRSEKDMVKVGKKLSDCMVGMGLPEESSNYIFVITNRYVSSEMYQYKKNLKINEDRNIGCKFVFFEMRRHTVELQNLVESYVGAEYHAVDNMEYFNLIIKKILKETGNG